MPSLFAFLHHLAAFAFVSVLAIEFVLMRFELKPCMSGHKGVVPTGD